MHETENDVTVMGQIFTYLKEEGATYQTEAGEIKPIITQSDLAEALEITKGYMSMLMHSTAEVSRNVQKTLIHKYNIDRLWLISNGAEGRMTKRAGRKKDEASVNLATVSMNSEQAMRSVLRMLEASQQNEKKLAAIIDRQSSTIERQQDTIEKLTQKLKK